VGPGLPAGRGRASPLTTARAIAAAAIMACLFVTACSVGPTRTSGHPGLVPSACWRPAPPGLEMRCGTVSVPERRSAAGGRTIRIAVAVVVAAGSEPRSVPTLLLAGGPGEGAIQVLRVFDDLARYERDGMPSGATVRDAARITEFTAAVKLWRDRLAERALVLIDQRGTGYSQPSLDCGVDDLEACRERLVRAGVDLAGYTTVENAADVDAVRQALGYDTVDLYGGSYGTRLGLEVLRTFGSHVRAAVLDGVAPAQLRFEVETVRSYDRTLRVLFDRCSSDPRCAAAFPNLSATFYAAVTQLDGSPVRVPVPGAGSELIDGQALRELVWQGMFSTQPIPWLPLVIADTAAGRTGTLAAYLASPSTSTAGDGISDGMRWSVECSGPIASETPEDVAAAGEGLPRAIKAGVVRQFLRPLEICAQWNVPTTGREALNPVSSDVPVLLLSGEFDPGTPPAYAEMAGRTLSRSTALVFPGLGHTQAGFTTCGQRLISAFLATPRATLDTSCVRAMAEPTFVTGGE
jgi:pimeloyl-ACP methyl ester carboxylesterase